MRRNHGGVASLGALVALFALVAPIGAVWAASPLRITSQVQVSKMDVNPARTYASPALAVDPDNPLNVLAATVDMRSRRCTMFRSGDGGATWKLLDANPMPPGFPFCFHTSGLNPQAALAWGRNQTLYWLTVGWDTKDGGNRRNQNVLLARSTDFGDSWKTTVVRSTRGFGEGVKTERNIPISVVVDSKSGQNDIVYASWRANYPLATLSGRSLLEDTGGIGAVQQPMAVVSTDGGKTFSDPINVSGNLFKDVSSLNLPGVKLLNTKSPTAAAPAPAPAAPSPAAPSPPAAQPSTQTLTAPAELKDAGSSAPIPAAWKKTEYFGGGNPFLAADDKGTLYALWQASFIRLDSLSLRVVPGLPHYLSKSTDRGKTWTVTEAIPASQWTVGPQLAWSKQGGADGTVHIVHEDKPGQTQGDRDLYYRNSTNGGKSFSEPKLINDDDPKLLAGQYGAGMSVAQNGRIDVAWFDFRDAKDNSNDIYYSSSTDNGKSWAKNARLTDRSINRYIGPWSNEFDMRQPVGIASINSYAVVGWDDTRNSDTVAEGQDVYSSVVQYSSVTGGVPSWLKYSLAALAGVAVVGIILLLVSMARRGEGEPMVPGPSPRERAEV
ncbi:MAG: sialidase family protein [Actinomycetota bacterium]